MKYIKKPIPVDAWQIVHTVDYPQWVVDAIETRKVNLQYVSDKKGSMNFLMVIKTLEGDMSASEGDYLIKGPKGEYWFNKREIFEEMYEAVDEA